jgi:hypothetical protein
MGMTGSAGLATLHRRVGSLLDARGQRYTTGRRGLIEALATLGRPATLHGPDRGSWPKQASRSPAACSRRKGPGDGESADNQVPPPGEAARGQLLRLMASDAMRAAVERYYGVRLAFQNCHRAAVFRPSATAALAAFTSPRAQLLNQGPELVDC